MNIHLTSSEKNDLVIWLIEKTQQDSIISPIYTVLKLITSNMCHVVERKITKLAVIKCICYKTTPYLVL